MEQFQNDSPECMEVDDNHDMTDLEDVVEGVESLQLDEEEDFDMSGRYQFKTVAHQSECSSNPKFPEHVVKLKKDMSIEDIIKDSALPFLPAKSLIRFKSVCKNWGHWINGPLLSHRQSYSFRSISGLFCQSLGEDPSFISLNPHAYGIPDPTLLFLPEYVEILSTCNGLLCCRGCNEDNLYYICNPATKEWKKLPLPNLYHGSKPAIILAFEPSQTNFGVDYDLICAVQLLDYQVTRFEIYSSAKGYWRVSDEIFCDGESNGLVLKSTGGFYMKGIAYWEISSGNQALAFALKEEQWGIQTLPFGTKEQGVLTEIGGELGYVVAHNQDNACRIEIYGDIDMKLKDKILLSYPSAPSLVGNIYGECRALPCLNSELLIIQVGRWMCSYDVRNQKLELLRLMHGDRTRYLPYVNSLVSLPT